MKEDFYWSPIDESGPFGSDAGSDAAYGFQKWRKSHPTTSPSIGTAFARFVMEGKVDPTLKNYAAKTIQREMLPIITRQFAQPDQVKAHNEKMNKLLQLVKKMPNHTTDQPEVGHEKHNKTKNTR